MQDLHHFFAAKHFSEINTATYDPLQWGSNIAFATQTNLNWDDADVVIIGCGEFRGANPTAIYSQGPDAIRRQLYQLYMWHPGIRITDAGNILQGNSADDTRAALRIVLHELHEAGKIVIVLGGSHDLTLQQYDAFKKSRHLINAAITDMLIDLDDTEAVTDRSFLMDMLTSEPNFVRHYTHIGFQSYYTNPQMLQTLDKLRFDFTRLGKAREHMDDNEPALRSANLFSFDMNAVRYSDAPANAGGSPNGFSGDEACLLTRYAGMATNLTSLGIYGYQPGHDTNDMSAKLIAQMLWYFIDGLTVRRSEATLENRADFAEFNVRFTANDALFLRSKRTGRWWMQLPDKQLIPCSYNDYLTASNDEIPERWLREQERLG